MSFTKIAVPQGNIFGPLLFHNIVKLKLIVSLASRPLATLQRPVLFLVLILFVTGRVSVTLRLRNILSKWDGAERESALQ